MHNKNDNQILTKIPFNELMETNSVDYFYSVITDRAIADIRDGLKPVQRRILYTGLTGHYDSSKPFKKAAKIVSDTMNYFHPHG